MSFMCRFRFGGRALGVVRVYWVSEHCQLYVFVVRVYIVSCMCLFGGGHCQLYVFVVWVGQCGLYLFVCWVGTVSCMCLLGGWTL